MLPPAHTGRTGPLLPGRKGDTAAWGRGGLAGHLLWLWSEGQQCVRKAESPQEEQ